MYELIVRAVLDHPWAILPEKLALIEGVLRVRAAGGHVSAEEIAAATAARRAPVEAAPGASGVAVIPVFGTIHQHAGVMADYSGGVSTDAIRGRVRQAMADPAVGSVVLDIDSPGGSVFGVPELFGELLGWRGTKPMVALADSMAASAAYWLACAADEVWVTPSGQVGSIGVYMAHVDASAAYEREGMRVSYISAGRYKVEGNDTEPLGDEARAEYQRTVDAYYGMFVGDVARGRAVSAAVVRDEFGEGRTVLAKAAKQAGMVDGIGTLDDAVARAARLAKERGRAAGKAAADAIRVGVGV